MRFHTEGLISGIGAALGASVILPILKDLAGQTLSDTIGGAAVAGNEVRKRLSFLKEELDDFIAEVEYERMRRRADLHEASD